MTGLERNADVVKLASYAPLLANIDHVQWRPDMIWFDNDESWGSTSYEVQKLFMNNVGDRVVPSTVTGPVHRSRSPITGAVGLSTWATAAAYDDVRVTAPDGAVLFSDDFSDGAGQWTPLASRRHLVGRGRRVRAVRHGRAGHPGQGRRHHRRRLRPARSRPRKLSGAEGFLVAFGVKDSGNFYWWNLGGWNNTQGAVEKAADGGKEIADRQAELGRDRHARTTSGSRSAARSVTLFLDGQEWGSFADDQVTEPFAQVVTRDDAHRRADRQGGQRAGHAGRHDASTSAAAGCASTAQMTVITGDPGEQNTRYGRADQAGHQHRQRRRADLHPHVPAELRHVPAHPDQVGEPR